MSLHISNRRIFGMFFRVVEVAAGVGILGGTRVVKGAVVRIGTGCVYTLFYAFRHPTCAFSMVSF